MCSIIDIELISMIAYTASSYSSGQSRFIIVESAIIALTQWFLYLLLQKLQRYDC